MSAARAIPLHLHRRRSNGSIGTGSFRGFHGRRGRACRGCRRRSGRASDRSKGERGEGNKLSVETVVHGKTLFSEGVGLGDWHPESVRSSGILHFPT